MTHWLSEPIESVLASDRKKEEPSLQVRTLIVGSGYGAAMAALALTEQSQVQPSDLDVVVFERGDEYLPGDFPKTFANLPTHFSLTGVEDLLDGTTSITDTTSQTGTTETVKPDATTGDGTGEDNQGTKASRTLRNITGLWDIRVGNGAISVAGNGLGGTSLVNASVVVEPMPGVLDGWPQPKQGSWRSRFSLNYRKINQLLGVQQTPDAESFAKFRAMKQVATAFGEHVSVEAAPVSINFHGPGEHSVDHGPCNLCGNCVIGCHSGAKQSLNMNAWPLAKQQGVKLFTGATVRALERNDDDSWNIRASLTREPKREFYVHAQQVILAAGTIGSTEILKRSEAEAEAEAETETETRGLSFSARLGAGFSTNGDGLIAGVGQQNAAHAVGKVPVSSGQYDVGPTIIGRAVVDGSCGNKAGTVTIEDGAVPYPLATLWNEITASQTFISRYIRSDKTAWHKNNAQHDFIAASESLSEHSQILLTMGMDGSHGELTATGEDGAVLPNWPVMQDRNGYYFRLHEDFRSVEKSGFDGGQYHPNPTWQALPSEFNGIFEGAEDIPKAVTTVHPLGGCCMGSSDSSGVVNTAGQVFKPSTDGSASTDVYPGLYVLDGSIVPGAIGTNPLLTIASLAYTLAGDLAEVHPQPEVGFAKLTGQNRKLPVIADTPPATSEHVTAVFSERLFWDLEKESESREDMLQAISDLIDKPVPVDTRALVVDIDFKFTDAGAEDDGSTEGPHAKAINAWPAIETCNSLDHWLENPQRKMRAHLTLRSTARSLVHSSEDTLEGSLEPVAELDGYVRLGGTDNIGRLRGALRSATAAARFATYRPFSLFTTVRDFFKTNPERIRDQASDGKKPNQLVSFIRIARLHNNWRYLDYRFGSTDGELLLSGRKKLAFTPSADTLWNALFSLPVTLRRGNNSLSTSLPLDLIRLSKGPAPLQVIDAQNSPTILMKMAAVGGYFARMIAQSHFWSFGAHNYREIIDAEKFDRQRMNWPPQVMSYTSGKGTRLDSAQRETYHGLKNLCRLVRYQPQPQQDAQRLPLLLVHGLAHSSEIFWTGLVNENYTQYFLSKGYDVWIVDHRTSANSIKQVDPAHTWDDIAVKDLKWAVTTIFNVVNENRPEDEPVHKVHCFSHCIGAGAMAISALDGHLQQANNPAQSMLASFVPHAVTPWLFASADNRARENGWALFKEQRLIDTVEPRLHNAPPWTDMVFDRIATSTITRNERKQWSLWRTFRDTRGLGFARAVYYRYTIFWGMQWNHRNVSTRLKRNFSSMIGPVPIAVMQQVYFSIIRKRLLGHEGANEYVTGENLDRRFTFPTLFLHGEPNKVFDIESSRLSAYQLHRHRTRNDNAPNPHYASAGVWLKTFDNYGHMDVIFGKSANEDICPHLDRFFQAAQYEHETQSADSSKRAYAAFASRYTETIDQKDMPKSHTAPSCVPFTGPIISHATADSFRVWVESEDDATEIPAGITAFCGKRQLRLEALSGHAQSESLKAGEGRFWLSDVLEPKAIDEPVVVHVDHPRHVAGDSAFPSNAVVAVDHLPWFRRLYGKGHARSHAQLSFIAGSCLHPGSTFERDRADGIFRGMLPHLEDQPEKRLDGIDLLLLLGDQIYADATANLFDPITRYERFRMRYRSAFQSTYMRKVMARVPTHFVVDDHAYTDNFDGDLDEADKYYFKSAKQEAWNFQSHRQPGQGGSANQQPLWHNFNVGEFPFFCFDTRFERRSVDRNLTSALLSDEQLDFFEQWLAGQQGAAVLFIASGTALAPVTRDQCRWPAIAAQSDGLVAYPAFLVKLTRLLHQYARNKKIYWLTGDPHLSCSAEVELVHEECSVNMQNVVASGLHSPYPFANAQVRHYDWGVPLQMSWPAQGLEMRFNQQLLSSAHRQFTRVDVLDNELSVTVCGPDGNQIDAPHLSALNLPS